MTKAKIIPIIAEVFGVDPETLKLETRFVEDLGADSLIMLEFKMQVEEQLGIAVPVGRKIETIADLL